MTRTLAGCCLIACTVLTLMLGLTGVAAAFDPNNCVLSDLQGADDEPGQKDLTEFCSGLTTEYPGAQACLFNSGFDFSIQWQWDDVAVSGGNTADACALFDTDSPRDGKANYAVCVTIGGTPATLQSRRVYSCANDNMHRCTNAVLIASPKSFCEVASAADPFKNLSAHKSTKCSGASCTNNDTSAACCIDLADFGGKASAELLDVCSFPSQVPNSDPSDCVKTPTSPNDPCTGVVCTPANDCSTSTCNSNTGQCVTGVKAAGTACGDQTSGQCDAADTCNGSGTCQANHVADGTNCGDSGTQCRNQ